MSNHFLRLVEVCGTCAAAALAGIGVFYGDAGLAFALASLLMIIGVGYAARERRLEREYFMRDLLLYGVRPYRAWWDVAESAPTIISVDPRTMMK